MSECVRAAVVCSGFKIRCCIGGVSFICLPPGCKAFLCQVKSPVAKAIFFGNGKVELGINIIIHSQCSQNKKGIST